MAKIRFKTDLSVNGIENLKKELLDYKNNILRQKTDLLVKKLADKGVEVARAKITSLNAIFTGELISSIHTEYGKSDNETVIFYVVADSSHAAFVEFGTGQMGKESPYPYTLPEGVEWNYNIGKTIFEISPGEYGWFYKRDGKWYFTQGMPSRPYMFETALELRELIVSIAKEVFG